MRIESINLIFAAILLVLVVNTTILSSVVYTVYGQNPLNCVGGQSTGIVSQNTIAGTAGAAPGISVTHTVIPYTDRSRNAVPDKSYVTEEIPAPSGQDLSGGDLVQTDRSLQVFPEYTSVPADRVDISSLSPTTGSRPYASQSGQTGPDNTAGFAAVSDLSDPEASGGSFPDESLVPTLHTTGSLEELSNLYGVDPNLEDVSYADQSLQADPDTASVLEEISNFYGLNLSVEDLYELNPGVLPDSEVPDSIEKSAAAETPAHPGPSPAAGTGSSARGIVSSSDGIVSYSEQSLMSVSSTDEKNLPALNNPIDTANPQKKVSTPLQSFSSSVSVDMPEEPQIERHQAIQTNLTRSNFENFENYATVYSLANIPLPTRLPRVSMNLVKGPLVIGYNVTPFSIEDLKYVEYRMGKTLHEENITVHRPYENSWFRVIVRNRDTGEIAEEDGIGRTNFLEHQRQLVIRASGNYTVEFEGEDATINSLTIRVAHDGLSGT